MVGDYIFTDKAFVQNLSTNRNVFQKIYDEVKYLCRVAVAGSKEARQLEQVKKTMAEVYRGTKGKVDSEKFSLDKDKKIKHTKKNRYSETETLFLIWENSSAPEGELKKFSRFGKTRYYQKTESGCVELSRAQYNERIGENAENTYRRAEREIGEAYDSYESSTGTVFGHYNGDRNSGRASTVFGQAFAEELRNDTGRGQRRTARDNYRDDIRNEIEASDDSDAFSVTFSNDYATIRNFMKEGDTGERDSDIQYSLSGINIDKYSLSAAGTEDIAPIG